MFDPRREKRPSCLICHHHGLYHIKQEGTTARQITTHHMQIRMLATAIATFLGYVVAVCEMT